MCISNENLYTNLRSTLVRQEWMLSTETDNYYKDAIDDKFTSTKIIWIYSCGMQILKVEMAASLNTAPGISFRIACTLI